MLEFNTSSVESNITLSREKVKRLYGISFQPIITCRTIHFDIFELLNIFIHGIVIWIACSRVMVFIAAYCIPNDSNIYYK